MTRIRFSDRTNPRNPWPEFEKINQGFDRLTHTFNNSDMFSQTGSDIYPPLNIFDTKDTFFITARIPGVKNDDLDLFIEDDSINLSGTRNIPNDRNISYHRKEIAGGQFNRTISLPASIDLNKTNATLQNGILTIILHKSTKAKSRSIKVSLEE